MVQRYNPDYVMHAARFAPFARENEHGEFVKFSDYETLKAERDALAQRVEMLAENLGNAILGEQEALQRVNALAVENAAIKAMNDCLSEELRGYESDGAFEGPNMHHLWWKAETPATDAALAAIQAQGVEKAAAALDALSAQSASATTQANFRAAAVYLRTTVLPAIWEAK